MPQNFCYKWQMGRGGTKEGNVGVFLETMNAGKGDTSVLRPVKSYISIQCLIIGISILETLPYWKLEIVRDNNICM